MKYHYHNSHYPSSLPAGSLPQTLIIIAVVMTVAILFLVVLTTATLIAICLRCKSKVTPGHQMTDAAVYEEVTSHQKRKERGKADGIEVGPNEAYQQCTVAITDNVAYTQSQR